MNVSGFFHQVGGHFGLLRCTGHVAKPLNTREHAFYSQLDGRLAPFSAEFCGRVRIGLQSTKDGIVLMTTESRLDCHSDQPAVLPTASEEEKKNEDSALFSMRFRLQQRRVQVEPTTQANLWAAQCQVRVVQKLVDSNDQQNSTRGPFQSFILLEDVVSKFNCPCVIDVKLGVRQHGDDADEQKKITQKQKCSESTSLKYGLRLVGLQLFDQTTESFTYVTKYAGRRMNKSQLEKTLAVFLIAAGVERTQRLLNRLFELKALIEKAIGFRFFSSSLLIAFDGRPNAENADEVVVKMIDFAHATFLGFLNDKAYEGADDGYLLGVNSLIGIVSGILEEMNDEVEDPELATQTRKRKFDWAADGGRLVSVEESRKLSRDE